MGWAYVLTCHLDRNWLLYTPVDEQLVICLKSVQAHSLCSCLQPKRNSIYTYLNTVLEIGQSVTQ